MYGFDTRSSFCRRKISSKVAACWLQNTLFLGHSHSHVLTGTYMWLNEREDNCQVREQASPIG